MAFLSSIPRWSAPIKRVIYNYINMFDTHCHLNFGTFDGKVDKVVDEAKKVGVDEIVIPGTDVSTSKKRLR